MRNYVAFKPQTNMLGGNTKTFSPLLYFIKSQTTLIYKLKQVNLIEKLQDCSNFFISTC